jgi:hypothetical protein
MDFLKELNQSEGGRRLVLNLHDGIITRRDLPTKLAKYLLEEAAALKSSVLGPDWYPHQPQVYQALFNAPSRYQYQGPPPQITNARWVTVNTVWNVVELIKQSPWGDATAIANRLGPFAVSPFPNPTERDCKFLARLLNDAADPIRFRLAKAFKDPTKANSRSHFLRLRPAPVWLSRWEDLKEACPELSFPSVAAAGKIRDWLGLPFNADTPLFAFVAHKVFDIGGRLAKRPTVLDGISNVLFKHRVFPPRGKDGCGATADINLLRGLPRDPDNIDGGPEVVARRIWFHPNRFECVYLGRTPNLEYELDGDFHTRLLGGRDLDEIERFVIEAFNS